MTNYDAFAETFSNSRKNMHWPEIDEILTDIEDNGYHSILDVGCGNGRLFGEIQKRESIRNMSYIGIDSSKGMIEEAQKIYPTGTFLVSSMPKFENMPEKQFDAIILLASFHHLETTEERATCLENIKKYLSPKGSLYMTNWNLLEQEKYAKNHRGNGDFDIKIGEHTRYYHGFKLDELQDIFIKGGFYAKWNKLSESGRNLISKVVRN
ncbi:MAG: hypothetical protein HHAS10_01640 [Candidatus Altimarinota bacterium]